MNRHTNTNPWNDARSYLPDCYDSLAVVEHYEKLARQARWKIKVQRFVKAFCIAVAVFAVVVFAGQIIRGAF